MKVFLLALLFLSAPFAQAQNGSGMGNGGRGDEPGFRYITTLLSQWIRTGALHLDLSQVKKKPDFKAILKRMDETLVQFNDVELSVWKSPRACKNYDETMVKVAYIECNITVWNSTRDEDKLELVFHEFLGLTKDEPNVNDFSRYPLSSQLLGINYKGTGSTSLADLIGQAEDPRKGMKVAPKEIEEFSQQLLKKDASLIIHPNGNIEMAGDYEFHGKYLSNGDYEINMSAKDNLPEVRIGKETLKVKYSSSCGHLFELRLIWSEAFGVKAIATSPGCAYQSSSGPIKTDSLILPDGSVKIEKYEKTSGSSGGPVRIFVDGVQYHGSYVSGQLR